VFVDSAKLYMKFDDKTLTDTITSNAFVVEGDNVDLEILDDGLGYVMKHDQNLRLDNFVFSISTDFSIGFWLYPMNQGQVINPDTGEVTNITMPVISFFAGTEPVIEILEMSQADETNLLLIVINDRYTVSTLSYVAEVFHFVYISWTGETGKIAVYIDGKEQPLSTNGSPQLSLAASSLDVFVNKINETGFNITQNTGYIDDVVVFNDSLTAAKRSSDAINFSVDFIVDTLLVNKSESGQAFLFDDPNTIRTTSMVDDLSFIYVARDDGKILRGSPLLWEVRKVFSENNEEDFIVETVLDVGDPAKTVEERKELNKASLDLGFLKIDKSIVRL
tara:strand:- start:1889 stop:2890 length:1002 start_codon:yes stop_codon:yes gene_type:complete